MNNPIRRAQYDPSSLPDLTGKVALVTGSNSPLGIGWNIANQLALKGAKVYIHARSLERAQAGIVAILANSRAASQDSNSANTKEVSAKQLEPFVVDLGDLKAVRKAAAAFAEKETRLDILVHNAAVLACGLELNEYGISTSMTINHIAPFLLTLELLPLIKSTARSHPGVRIVTLSSVAHTLLTPDVKYDSLSSINNDFGERDGEQANLQRYGYSKLANLLFAKELQRKLNEAGIQAISVAVHPGVVETDGAIKYVGPEKLSQVKDIIGPLQGALAPLFAAAATEVWTEKDGDWAGAYVMPYGVPSPVDESEAAKDPKLAKELWEATEKILAENVGISVSF
ncbi:short-chain dehydrogenase [Lentinula boryana]|uniref:Short-chain dehydrogenase n=1 Tax=Lentinula boryana TaxID=40481 RepID=A0ABQ8QIE1_9AGAR|nr:short-chain dehydrogenase [Lentinula boryana]